MRSDAGPSRRPQVLASAQMLYTPLTSTPSSVSISHDGQILAITREELNIYTPALGIQVSNVAGASASTTSNMQDVKGDRASSKLKGKAKEDQTPSVNSADARTLEQLYRCTIPVEKKNIIHWGAWVNDTYASTAGSAEVFWRSATWSPTCLSSLGGCALLAITNNGEALLFEPEKNAHIGPWREVYDLTSHLMRLILPDPQKKPSDNLETPLDRRRLIAKTHECQATACSWSEAVTSASGDFSILVVGHRTGHIALWRKSRGGAMDILHRYRMSPDAGSISLLSWSHWDVKLVDGKEVAVACLAAADVEGRVWVLEVSQNIDTPHPAFAQCAGSDVGDENVEDVWASDPILICPPDAPPATQMTWICNSTDLPRLAFTKIGAINIASLAREDSTSSGSISLVKLEETELTTRGTWMGASSFAQCCGLGSAEQAGTILAALADASLHAIHLNNTMGAGLSSHSLTRSLRSLFEQHGGNLLLKGSTPTKKEGSRTTGFCILEEDDEIIWTYELVRPDSVTYRAPANTRTILILASLWGDIGFDAQLARGKRILDDPGNSRYRGPLARLRSLLHFVNDYAASAGFVEALLGLLTVPQEPSIEHRKDMLASKVDVTRAMIDQLFGEESIERLRLAETVIRFLTRQMSSQSADKYTVLSRQTSLARQIAKEVTTRLAQILSRSQDILGRQELAISGRLALASASLLPITRANNPIDDDDDGEELLPADALGSVFTGEETCPACRADIPFANIRNACCVQGHQWERCSITLSVVASVHVRTCIGCERKALDRVQPIATTIAEPSPLPRNTEEGEENRRDTSTSASAPPPTTQATTEVPDSLDVINAILKEATCCLYCGERWMRIR